MRRLPNATNSFYLWVNFIQSAVNRANNVKSIFADGHLSLILWGLRHFFPVTDHSNILENHKKNAKICQTNQPYTCIFIVSSCNSIKTNSKTDISPYKTSLLHFNCNVNMTPKYLHTYRCPIFSLSPHLWETLLFTNDRSLWLWLSVLRF